MTQQELLEAARRSAEPNEAGLRHLEARMTATAKDLAGARDALAACEAHEIELGHQHAKINAHLATLNRAVKEMRGKNARTVLDAVHKLGAKPAEILAILASCATAGRSLTDQVSILREVLQYVAIEAKPIAAIRKTKALIAVAQASRAWTEAAACHDLLTLQIKMGAALAHDPSLSVSVGPESRVHVYTEKINGFDLEIAELQELLRREEATAQKFMEASL